MLIPTQLCNKKTVFLNKYTTPTCLISKLVPTYLRYYYDIDLDASNSEEVETVTAAQKEKMEKDHDRIKDYYKVTGIHIKVIGRDY